MIQLAELLLEEFTVVRIPGLRERLTFDELIFFDGQSCLEFRSFLLYQRVRESDCTDGGQAHALLMLSFSKRRQVALLL